MALANKNIAFKKHFDIEFVDKDVEFMLDKKNNFIAIFQGKEYTLNNQRYKDKFVTSKSMKFDNNYGVTFLRAIGLEASKEKKKAKEKAVEKNIKKFKNKQINKK